MVAKLTALGRLPRTPPAHRCACGCGQEASLGFPLGRWYVPGHQAAEGGGPGSAAGAVPPAPAPAADLFEAGRVFAPRRRGDRR